MKYFLPHGWFLARPFLLMGALCLLSGCAGTRVRHEQMTAASGPIAPPRSIAITVTDKSPAPHRARRIAGHLADVKTAEGDLIEDLTKMLVARHLVVVAAGKPADLSLECAITSVRSGSTVARLLIGYGAGKAVLNTVTTVISTPATSPVDLLTFTTSGITGAMPGAGLGVMSAAGAAGTAVHMIGPLLGVPGTLKQGLTQEAQQTTARVDDELASLFAKHGWPYARPSRSMLSRF